MTRRIAALFCLLGALSTAGGVLLGSASPPPQMVFVPMRDGILLSTDLYVPTEQSGPFPTILIRTPYGRLSLTGYGIYFSGHGYAVAIQDVRGRYGSDGDWTPFLHEGVDGYDAVEWLAAQPWSTGRVGMYGGSYSAFAQFSTALLAPPHLVTIIPNISAGMPFDGFPYVGGALLLGSALRWVDLMESAQTPDQMAARSAEQEVIDWTRILDVLPVLDLDQAVLGHEVDYWRDWIAHNTSDGYWDPIRYLDGLHSLEIPVFLQSGWFDPGSRGTLMAYLSLAQSESPAIKLIMGPWAHTDQSAPYLYGEYMGAEADIGLMSLYIRWFDRWLREEENGMLTESLVQVFNVGPNTWINGEEYPLPSTRSIELPLEGKSDVTTSGPHLGLASSWNMSTDECSTYNYDPMNPAPCFSEYLQTGRGEAFGRAVAERSDLLVFDTTPLATPLTIAGPMSMKLFAKTSCVDTDWCITVCGVTPDGDSYPIGMTWGIVRVSFLNSGAEQTLVEPDEVHEYRIDLSHTGFTLPVGDRLRVVISSSCFPEFSRNLNTGAHSELTDEVAVAHQTVFHSGEYPSALVLWIAD